MGLPLAFANNQPCVWTCTHSHQAVPGAASLHLSRKSKPTRSLHRKTIVTKHGPWLALLIIRGAAPICGLSRATRQTTHPGSDYGAWLVVVPGLRKLRVEPQPLGCLRSLGCFLLPCQKTKAVISWQKVVKVLTSKQHATQFWFDQRHPRGFFYLLRMAFEGLRTSLGGTWTLWTWVPWSVFSRVSLGSVDGQNPFARNETMGMTNQNACWHFSSRIIPGCLKDGAK